MSQSDTPPVNPANPLPPLSADEYAALRESIARDGFLYPIIESAGPAMRGQIVDGFNRIAIGKELGVEVPRITRPFESEAEFHLAQIDANLQRRQLTIPQRVLLAMAREPWERRLAVQRQLRGVRGETVKTAREKDAARATDIAAHAVGLTRSTYEHAKFVIDKAPEEIRAEFLAGGMTVNRAYRATRQAVGLDSRTVLATATTKRFGRLPNGSYGAIVLTPPWRTQAKRFEAGRLLPAELSALELRGLAAKDAIVVLVTPARWLREALELTAETWGLSVLTVMVRLHPRATATVDRAEFAIVAGAGKSAAIERQENVLETDAQMYALLDAAVPDAAGIRLFGEINRKGWNSWNPNVK